MVVLDTKSEELTKTIVKNTHVHTHVREWYWLGCSVTDHSNETSLAKLLYSTAKRVDKFSWKGNVIQLNTNTLEPRFNETL